MLQEQDAKIYHLSAFAPASCCVTWFWFVKAKAQEEPIAVSRYGGIGIFIQSYNQYIYKCILKYYYQHDIMVYLYYICCLISV